MRFFDSRARGDPDVEHVADVAGPQCRGEVRCGAVERERHRRLHAV